MRFSALVIDDEADARLLITTYLKKLFPQVEVVAEVECVEEAYEILCAQKIDFIFLDVQMPDGTGFDLLQMLSHPMPEVVFVTAFEEYAIKAIKVAALDYILKPVLKSEFQEAVQKMVIKHREKEKSARSDVDRLRVPTKHGQDFVNIGEIMRCEADNSYTVVFLRKGGKRLVSKNLAQFERELSEHNFLRIHHKHLVNLDMIKSYNRGKGGGFVILQDDQMIPVSVRKKTALIDIFASA